jgi:dTDP-4-amino-4,6-dideoxygalactose transaminase
MAAADMLSIPVHPGLSDDDCLEVAAALNSVAARALAD